MICEHSYNSCTGVWAPVQVGGSVTLQTFCVHFKWMTLKQKVLQMNHWAMISVLDLLLQCFRIQYLSVCHVFSYIAHNGSVLVHSPWWRRNLFSKIFYYYTTSLYNSATTAGWFLFLTHPSPSSSHFLHLPHHSDRKWAPNTHTYVRGRISRQKVNCRVCRLWSGAALWFMATHRFLLAGVWFIAKEPANCGFKWSFLRDTLHRGLISRLTYINIYFKNGTI